MRENGLKTVTYKSPHTGLRVLLCLLLGAIIVLVSLRVQAHLGIPAPISMRPAASAAPRGEDSARASQELALSAHSLYALQLGAFTQESAARQLAQEYVSRGAAGYVYHDGEAWRVLAAAYPTRAEAQGVQTRLAAQNISTYIHPCIQDALRLRVGGTERQVGAFGETLGYLDGLGEKLYALSLSLDNREVEAADARAALLSEGTTCAALASTLSAAFEGETPAALAPLAQTLSALSEEAQHLPADAGAARVGAALKRCQLVVFFGLASFVGTAGGA